MYLIQKIHDVFVYLDIYFVAQTVKIRATLKLAV